MPIKRTAIEIYRDLTLRYGICNSMDHGRSLSDHLRDGTTPEDYLLPGRAVMNLSEEDREELKKLTSEEVMKERNPFTR